MAAGRGRGGGVGSQGRLTAGTSKGGQGMVPYMGWGSAASGKVREVAWAHAEEVGIRIWCRVFMVRTV